MCYRRFFKQNINEVVAVGNILKKNYSNKEGFCDEFVTVNFETKWKQAMRPDPNLYMVLLRKIAETKQNE